MKATTRLVLLCFAFLVVVQSAEIELGRKRLCPACIDEAYINFVYDHPGVYHPEYRIMMIPNDIDEFKCKDGKFTTMECHNSCLRSHLTNISENNVSTTIGWMFYCSTDVVKKTPSWLKFPTNLDNFDDDYYYVDKIVLTWFYQVTFYANASHVEKPEDYYSRISGSSKKDSSIQTFFSNLRMPHGGVTVFVFAIILLMTCWIIAFCCKCEFEQENDEEMEITIELEELLAKRQQYETTGEEQPSPLISIHSVGWA